MNDLKCPSCNGSSYRNSKYRTRSDGTRVKELRCCTCNRVFPEQYRQPRAKPAGKNCPKCNSSNTVLLGSPVDRGAGKFAQRARCKDCKKNFQLDYPERQPGRVAQPAGKNCPECQSTNTVKIGLPTQWKHGLTQVCQCKDCKKQWTDGGLQRKALMAGVICEYCGSTDTIKVGQPFQRKHGIVQPCRCNSCNRKFSEGKRKINGIVLNGVTIYTYWDPPGLKMIQDISCPNCNGQEIVLKYKPKDTKNVHRKGRGMLCISCGQEFKNEGREWQPEVLSRMGKAVPHRPWSFHDDVWDLRELYPNIEEHKFNNIHLFFENCGDDWFKELAKKFILSSINVRLSPNSLLSKISILRLFGQFLKNRGLASLEKLDRQIMGIYWTQERGHVIETTLHRNMTDLRLFLRWARQHGNSGIPINIISNFDLPKKIYGEPDPLEDSVLEQIRDNLHVLPEQLQLMFMLGFWLGTRPRELCFIRKDCLKLDPDGTNWWLEFERDKTGDYHRLPITTDLVKLIQEQQSRITKLYGKKFSYLFCHYQYIGKTEYPDYPRMKPMEKPPIPESVDNPMVKAIKHIIEKCDIRDSNGQLAKFKGSILRPSRATHLIQNGFSLDFVRIWLKHRSAKTTKRHYTRYNPGELLDVASVMANLDSTYYRYDSDPESLRKNPESHELDGLTMLNGEPLYGYCSFRDFCPKFGHCYSCGFHIATADKLPLYKAQLEKLKVKENLAFSHGSAELLSSYQQITNQLEAMVEALEEAVGEQDA